MVFTKTGGGGTDHVWFYDMQADGFSLDDKRNSIAENDIEDIIARFGNLAGEADRKRTDKSFFVPKAEIVGNGYDLSINKYKETEHVEVEYERPEVILAGIRQNEVQILEGIKQLEELISR